MIPRLDQFFLPYLDAIDPERAYAASYSVALVALSLAIAIASAYVALSVSDRLIATRTQRGRFAWTGAGAVAMGGGIWSMHFLGMLAFSLPCRVGYEPVGTFLSILPGVLASGVALNILARKEPPGYPRLTLGAVLMGGGIGAMHYSGMAAMRPEALLLYDSETVLLSVFVAVALAFIGLGVRFRLQRSFPSMPRLATSVGAIILGLAVSGMHYTAMEAANFFAEPGINLGIVHFEPTTLAVVMVVLVLSFGAATMAAAYSGAQIDTAQRVQAEMEQRLMVERDAARNRARTQAIMDSVADAIVTIDRGGRIRQWSRGAERIFGYGQDEMIGADITMLMPQPHRSRHDQYVGSFISTREAKIIGLGRELTALRKDGTEFPIDLTVTEVKGIDEVLFTGILRDITDRKRAEQELIDARRQAEDASRAKSEFLATMSHEIRTPMNGVLGMANLLASTNLNERQSRLTDNLFRSGQVLMGIINDILDFSKIEAGRLELLESDFEPRELVAEIADLFAERCIGKGLELVYFIDETVPTTVRGDPIRLRQVLTNLVGNAIKFTEHGEILIELVVAESQSEEVMLKFAVADTGIGIAPEHRAAVFESFHQIDSSMTRSRGGSGLGLAIVRRLVTLMGGIIDVESDVGRGSRFWFTARLRKSAGERASPRCTRHLARPLSVLLVDLNSVSAQVTAQYLNSWGLKPEVCTSINKARRTVEAAIAAGGGYDVAIIDVKGASATARELMMQIGRFKGRKATEIILLADSAAELDEPAGERDAFVTLAKPLRPSELFDSLALLAAGTSARNAAPRSARSRSSTRGLHFNAHVLVAEDNAVNQEVVVGMLENFGCRAVTVGNGRAAVQAILQDRFDLILMDCEMPEMDGFQAARKIRDTERLTNELPENRTSPRRIPIIAVTAHALPEMRDRCTLAGMDDFITKPFDDVQLAEALRRHLHPSSVEAGGVAFAEPQPAAEPVEAPAPVAPEPIDSAALEQIRAIEARGSKGLLERVIGKFAAQAPAMVAEARDQYVARDAEALWRTAHALKSSASAVGAALVAQRCAEIEQGVRATGVDAAAGQLDILGAELATALQALRSVLVESDNVAS